MKPDFRIAALIVLIPILAAPIRAQDSPAAIAAAREEAEANFKEIRAKMEQLEDGLRKQQSRITTLVDEIHALREEVDRLKTRNESAATQESIKRLAEKIEEVDKKRIADSELVSKKLAALGKEVVRTISAKEPVAPPPVKNEKPASATPAGAPEKAFEYKIKDGDTLSRIVNDLRAQGWKITQKQVMDVNPGVNWSKLRIGQTVYIPQPAQ
jgi:DNA repair exonuclease SbcCD ATPase subunit